jgi:hypothetical protein
MAAMRKVYRTWCELGRETSGRQPFWLQLNSSCWDEEKLNYEYCKDSYKRNKAVIERKFLEARLLYDTYCPRVEVYLCFWSTRCDVFDTTGR